MMAEDAWQEQHRLHMQAVEQRVEQRDRAERAEHELEELRLRVAELQRIRDEWMARALLLEGGP